MKSIVDRFLDKVLPEPMSGCWLWAGNRKTGRKAYYGAFTIDGKIWRAHRLAFELFRHAVPDGLNVLHKCDTPPCVNPDHLFLGTIQDNNADRHQKGRTLRGEQHAAAKLTEEQARQILNAPSGLRELARQFDVSIRTIKQIRGGKAWRHLQRA